MKDYNILYIEDENAKSIQEDLKSYGLIVETLNPINFDMVLNEIHRKSYDAYIMDFRLTSGTGRVDAPTFAATLRTNGKNQKKAPLIMITNENYLSEFENDFTSQDLFDMVLTKPNLRNNYEKYSQRIKSLIDAYRFIKNSDFDINKILGIDSLHILDYRFLDCLESFRNKEDLYGYVRTISNSLIRAIGPLVGTDVLAARLGIDIQCDDYAKLLNTSQFLQCKYTGILSNTYERWWFDKIKKIWESISNESLRRTEARDRVFILNENFNLSLEAATPLEMATSSTFWTICHKYQKPLDPSEGYQFRYRHFDEWLEPEYISLIGALENPNLQRFLSPIDKEDVLYLGNIANESK